VVLPHWNASATQHAALCAGIAKLGMNALRLSLPYHDFRMPAELERADYAVSGNVTRLELSLGENYDEQAYQECLARSVRDVVQAQRDAGIDIVRDGEFGKSAWNYYVYERLGGIELRPSPPGDANFASVNDAPTDWARFPEFYADYFAHEQEYESRAGTGPASRR